MKSLLFPLLFASAAIAVSAADSPSLTGTWNIHNNIAGNESDMACNFTQKDKDLTGTCKGEQGSVNINGKIEDKKVSWVYKSEYNGGPITLTYGGNLDSGDKISGTVRVEEYGVEGEFTANASK